MVSKEPTAEETAQRMMDEYGRSQAIDRANEHGLANSMGKNLNAEVFWKEVISILRRKK